MTSIDATPLVTSARDGRRGATVLLAAGIIVALSVVAGVLQLRATSAPTSTFTVGGSDALLALERAVLDRPEDAQAWAQLGGAYVDHARVNADPSAYPKAARALDRSLELDRDGNWEALAAKAALAAGRHDFAPALALAEQARALQPASSFVLGIVVDALTELGRYPEAVDAAQAMVDLRPDLASYARVSYQRELHGDVDGAIDAMVMARRAASTPGDRAFAEYYLGELEWHRGAVDEAAAHYDAALRADPTAAQALAGLGKVAAARGDLDVALARYDDAVAAFPDPEALKELGELHLVAGDRDAAERRFQEAAAANAAQAAGGVDVNLELALFSADHRRDLDAGLAAARDEWSRRQSIHVADALAWQLFAHGRFEEALTYANEALKLGTRNASFHHHRGRIHRALGNHEAARADLDMADALNPHFSFLPRDPG